MAVFRNVFLVVACVFLASAVQGGSVASDSFTMPASLGEKDIYCLDECKFQADNQTIIMINITNPKLHVKGVAYYATPIRMKDPASKTVASFNTTFTFREEPKNFNASPVVTLEQSQEWRWGDGFTFMMTNSSTWKGDTGGRFGIFAGQDSANPKVVAVEFDNFANQDTDPLMFINTSQPANVDNHLGLDIGSANSTCFSPRSYLLDLNISLWQRNVIYTWIEYNGNTSILEARLAKTPIRPSAATFRCTHDLADAVDEKMWIGFSAAIGNEWTVYYMYNWTFTSFGISPFFASDEPKNVGLIAGLITGGSVILLGLCIAIVVCLCVRRRRAREESVDKEGLVDISGMPEFISYKHLSAATKQFSDQSKLGQGGFGSVYQGVLPRTGERVAVKKVSNDSRQGEKEFLAEVKIISQLRHRNIVELTGFCRNRGKFLLVYELLPNGSLDQALFNPKSGEHILSWSQRWRIVSGTAAALHYLHEGWRKQVIHRDVKSSNIMLDDEYNAKLGDFGLARLVDHSKNAATTMVAGTYGYIAPEAVGGRYTDKTDVFAFGAVALEVACGRRAYDETTNSEEDLLLVEMVWRHWKEGDLLIMADRLMRNEFDPEEMSTVMKLGLLCSHPDPASRPSMRQVVQVLAGEAEVPDVPEIMPETSALDADMPQISIDDLLLERGSRPHSQTSTRSKSGRDKRRSNESVNSTNTSASDSFGIEMRGR